jgi:hypothetical protein
MLDIFQLASLETLAAKAPLPSPGNRPGSLRDFPQAA